MMRNKQKKARRTPIIAAGIVSIVIIFSVGSILLFDFPIANPFKFHQTPEAVSDKEVDQLKSKTPELFKGTYATVSEQRLREKILGDKKDRKLLVAEAGRRGITDVGKQLTTSLGAIQSGYGTKEDFKNYLSERGITEAELKEELHDTIIINELAKNLINQKDISGTEAKSYFESNKSRYPAAYSAAKQQVMADLLGNKRSQAIEELLTKLKGVN